MDLKLTGKIALVTGSSRGIGLATAKAFAAEGCRVVLSGRSTEQLRTPGAGEPDADDGLARRCRHARWRGCGYDAALGQRCRVAHIPTAAATASSCSLTISGGRSGGASN